MDTKTSAYHLTHHHHHLHQQTKKQTSAAAVIVRSRPVQFAQTLARVFRIGRKEKISKKAANKVRGHDAQIYLKNFLANPELLTEKTISPSSDLWALGCIIYQMIAGLPPFRSRSEYMLFKKILNLDYVYPDGFNADAKDLVQKLLVLDPNERLGTKDDQRYISIRSHPFYSGLDFDTLHLTNPPPIYPYLPGNSEGQELRSQYRVPDHLEPGLDDKQLTRLLGLDGQSSSTTTPASVPRPRKRSGILHMNDEEKQHQLNQQKCNSKWHGLVEGNLIVKQGLVDKRKGLFARRRMLMLTMGPHLYYADPASMTLKGEIPWSPQLRVEPKNFRIFFVHTPNRTYYLEDPEGFALEWCKAIEEMRVNTYGVAPTTCT
ncbi:PREDICTED: 3-phosphoinositide-dependent protein kinase 1-like [Diuraphis noxia]|uniref:3-phosphoinositide-dependent protein kinase 1-like n=1 Tax=Diuraphis noxia TaxID=143948 RepID=UPI000763845B|nr:PREDICTED: 3-phosphoinositide-dependent protein kinase 1-like [Diuraphis noxia]